MHVDFETETQKTQLERLWPIYENNIIKKLIDDYIIVNSYSS